MENFEQQRYEKAKKRVENEKGFYGHLTVYLIINIALLLINADILDNGLSSLLRWELYITPVAWGIGVFAHGMSVFGKRIFFNKEWEQRKIKELMDKDDF